MHNLSPKNLASLFSTFAKRECKNVSPLYEKLAHEIAGSEELLAIAKNCRKRQPIPNLFLGAIHYLLLKHEDEKLRSYYPSISKQHCQEIPFKLILEFCSKREQEIRHILQTRIVQTNSINRTAYLMPIVASIGGAGEPMNVVDIGTSSGLTMNLDLYEYSYGNGENYGKSSVKINSQRLEGKLPTFTNIPQLNRKIGIDQNPLDLRVDDNALWLKALIWPDMLERFEQMEAAIEIAKKSNLALHKADQIAEFESILMSIPLHEPLFVYHTHVLYQFKPNERRDFRQMLDLLGQKRDYGYMAVEADSVFDKELPQKGVLIELTRYEGGRKKSNIVGQTDGHATWIKFFHSNTH